MSRILLKIFAVPNKQPLWSKFKIPSVPILVTHIIKFLVTAPSAPITIGTTDTLTSSTSFVFRLLSPGSGQSSLDVFPQFRYQKDMPNRWFGALCSPFPVLLYRACYDLSDGLFEFGNPTVTSLGHFPSLPLGNDRTKFRCKADRNFGRVSNEQL